MFCRQKNKRKWLFGHFQNDGSFKTQFDELHISKEDFLSKEDIESFWENLKPNIIL